ncbi:MAG: hypothetical protein BWY35_01838 [Firmicutes bacterium ADurb.Bin248]|nr:MAG: hypothetical protein BWY35_01838 [Firmicutes bacterium ADurb.Bin248]HOG01451.1 GNAT family protein [Clostridia bacterium]HPK15655.1 GNAT family protein [Clostridia bacterium]
MRLIDEKVILRDMIASDVEDRVRWETIETEWLGWDAPWENDPANVYYVPFDEAALRRSCAGKLSRAREDDEPRASFEICVNDAAQTHIGWCNSYRIDEQCFYSPAGDRLAIGIDIPPAQARHKGYATAAWRLFIGYLIENGASEVYTQTWSGNIRVLGLIEKLGFVEIDRKQGIRHVRGARYDALTFRLTKAAFEKLNQE